MSDQSVTLFTKSSGAVEYRDRARNERSKMKDHRPFILGIGGTARDGSTSERALAVSLRAAEAAGARTGTVAGSNLILPMYPPSDKGRSNEAMSLVSALRDCDGIVVSSPAYHGTVSGLVKNALDYAEDLRTDMRPYLDGMPVGCIVCAGGWQAAGQALGTLRAIAHSLRGWPTPLGAMLNTSTSLFDENGSCLDLSARMQLETVGRQVVEFARMRMATALTQVLTPSSKTSLHPNG